ncbi:MAG: CHAT domain-containing protein [Anaerolineales bacterium]|nr:CHAT domain-containing protein [Anaerolineales bacterium]
MSDQPGAPPPHFIVLVPGYMGSRLRNRRTGELVWLDVPALLSSPFHIREALERLFDQMRYPNDDLEPDGIIDQLVFVPPLLKQEHYGRLLEKLEDIGYDSSGGRFYPDRPPVYTFAYDWRQDNRISARQLGQAIQGWRERHPGAKAWLIGHSNGGIVSRWYIEKEGGAEHVERLFLMGSPWDGAPKAMQVFIDGLGVFLLRLLGRYADIPSLTRQVVQSFPSFYQLIPSHFPFLHDAGDKPIDPFEDMSWLNNDRQRQMLLDGRRFNQELGLTLSVETLCFFGVKKPTTVGGRLPSISSGGWKRISWDRAEAGDGTVPQRSAVHPQASQKLPYSVGHGDIYVNPAVLDKLAWELVDKYRVLTLDVALTEHYSIQFEPEGDVFDPSQEIPVWATVFEKESGAPVHAAQIKVRLEWRQGLFDVDQPPPEGLPEIELVRSAQGIGRYEGKLVAPETPGYYRLAAEVEVAGEPSTALEELILVEGEFDLAQLSEELKLESAYRDWTPKSPPDDVRRTWREPGQDDFMADEEHRSPRPERSYEPEEAAEGEAEEREAGSETGQRYINAEITDHDNSQPLPLGQEFALALFVDTKGLEAYIPFDETRLAQDEQFVRLSVQVSSSDFIVHTRQAQELRVPRVGRSRNKARFDLEPKRAGVGEVTALFYRENNFTQGMTLKLNVGSGQGAIAGYSSLGRPLEGMGAVQPRDILLFIKNMGDRFDLTMIGAAAAHASLPVTLQELNYKIFEARQALLDVVYLAQGPSGLYVHPRGVRPAANVKLPYQAAIDIPAEVGEEALKRLAAAGWLLYNDLFYGPGARADANQMGDRLRELAEKNTLKLQIVSQEFFLPWGLLYLAEYFDPDDIQPQRFLGLKHMIEHIPLQERMPVLDSAIPSNKPRLAVSLNMDAGIDQAMGLNVVEEQIQYWKAIESNGKARLCVRLTDQELLEALKDPQAPDQILYFYGHAASQELDDPGGPNASALTLTGGKTVTLRDLQLRTPMRQALPNAPLVFINACESAKLSPLFYGGFMPYFTSRGARGMIGAECELPAVFAAEWARRFFDRFLYQNKPLGEIFLALRQEFFNKHNNLLGLLYALYCDGDTRVMPGLD